MIEITPASNDDEKAVKEKKNNFFFSSTSFHPVNAHESQIETENV